MADNVVQFPQADERRLIWVCDCGCTTHYHHASGDVECGSCGKIASGATEGWREHLPPLPADPPTTDATAFKVVNLGGSDAFLRRLQKEPSRRFIAIVAIDDQGATATWNTDCDTDARREWLRRQMSNASERMAGCP